MKLQNVIHILIGIVCFALCQQVQATPDPGRVDPFNTADGDHALFSNTTGVANSAFGWYALSANTDGSNNTAVGAGALDLNTGNSNTAVGTAALLLNTDNENTAVGTAALENNTLGGDNTANGAFALFGNTTGDVNTATGALALFANTEGNANTAIGDEALKNNTTGSSNTAVGEFALGNNTTGSENIALGASAGSVQGIGDGNIFISSVGAPGDSNTIRIGSGLQTATFIDGIASAQVDGNPVVVDSLGQLGVAPAGSPLSKNELRKQQHLVQELKATTERQAATIALQERQIAELTAGLQRVSAQLEVSKPAPQVVNNNQ